MGRDVACQLIGCLVQEDAQGQQGGGYGGRGGGNWGVDCVRLNVGNNYVGRIIGK